MCSLLEKEGYHTFAMHNNKSSFYDRKDVYNEMGFERFISLEYMYNVEKTSTGWAKDEILVNNIKKLSAEYGRSGFCIYNQCTGTWKVSGRVRRL